MLARYSMMTRRHLLAMLAIVLGLLGFTYVVGSRTHVVMNQMLHLPVFSVLPVLSTTLPLNLSEIALVPATCQVDSAIAAYFDSVYERGFIPPEQYAKVRPYFHSKNAHGDYDITPEQVAHYYKMDEHRYSLSGDGSMISSVTPAAKWWGDIVTRENIFSVLDVPCGDVNWQMSIPEIDRIGLYVGLDIARFPLKLAKARYAHHRNKLFAQWDLSTCEIPRWMNGTRVNSFDLVHLRDVIQHLTYAAAKRAIRNIVDTGVKYLVTTTYPSATNPQHVAQSENIFYQNNMELPPFSFYHTLDCVRSHPSGPHLGAQKTLNQHFNYEDDVVCMYEVNRLKEIVSRY